MELRAMRESDIPRVVALAGQLGYELPERDAEERLRRLAGHPDYGLFVAVREAFVVGWVQVNREALALLAGPRADVAALVVDERVRSSGIGKLLLFRAEAWARENGLTTVRVRSSVRREAAHRFYHREGYALLKTGHTFEKVLEPGG
jgi:GNAT superfamily N-acetyltransferase